MDASTVATSANAAAPAPRRRAIAAPPSRRAAIAAPAIIATPIAVAHPSGSGSRAHFAAGQRGAPTRVRCYLAEATLLASTGQRADAIAALERGLARVPGDPELTGRLAALRGSGD